MTVYQDGINPQALLERGFMALEDGNWLGADDFFERVLDIDAASVKAYLGKLMAELNVRRQEDLPYCAEPFDDSDNYKKVLRFADEALAKELKSCIGHINARNRAVRLDNSYKDAVDAMRLVNTESGYELAAKTFHSMNGYRDADALAEYCLEKAKQCHIEDQVKLDEARKARKKAVKLRWTLIASAAACVAFAVLLVTVIIPSNRYSRAMEMYKAGNYTEAYDLFNSAGFKDNSDMALKCLFNKQKGGLSDLQVGDTVKFGLYEQDRNSLNGRDEIKWQVLDIEGDRALIISRYALDNIEYNKTRKDVTWETCTLRKWLNETFMSEAFSPEHQAKILTSAVPADINPRYGSDPGNSTVDKIFLLSIAEAEKYFPTAASRRCIGTDYCFTHSEEYARNVFATNDGNSWWWLRSPGYDAHHASLVMAGNVIHYGMDVDSALSFGVRPAMWISIAE